MSPELKRNLWLEMTGSRVVLMTSVLGLVAIAVFLVSGRHFVPLAPLGVVGFVFITIFWGARNAARSVIGEIRERTWDFQRLSAMTPASMTAGKLLGATSYTWYGGLLALLIALPGTLRVLDGRTTALVVGLLIAAGILAQATALGSALASARRRRAEARLSVLPHQAVGLVAAYLPTWIVGFAGDGDTRLSTEGVGWARLADLGQTTWLGSSYDTLELALAATLAFAAWAVVGAWREMRLELMETNTPVVWPAFLAFLALFLAGFGETVGAGLWLAYLGVHVAAMASLISEPKNAVELRALGDAIAHGRIGRALVRMPAYGWAFLVAAGLALAVTNYTPVTTESGRVVIAGQAIAWLGFLARDIGVFHVFHAKPRQTRGDFAGLVTLALLYVLGGAVGSQWGLYPLFLPTSSDAPGWMAAFPWGEAMLVWALAIARFRGARAEPSGAPARA